MAKHFFDSILFNMADRRRVMCLYTSDRELSTRTSEASMAVNGNPDSYSYSYSCLCERSLRAEYLTSHRARLTGCRSNIFCLCKNSVSMRLQRVHTADVHLKSSS